MTKNSFSIIVPVYNTAAFLDKCLKSIQEQYYDNFEVIIVDDGSTDDSFVICKQYQGRDPRFHVYTKENEGQGVARNVGLSKAAKDYILYVDSDDTIEKDTLNAINEALVANPDSDIVNYLINFVDENNKIYHQSSGFSTQSMTGEEIFLSAMLDREILSSPCNKVYRRLFLIENAIEFPALRKNEDILYSRMVGYFAKKAIFINRVFYHALIRGNSTSRSVTKQNFIDSISSVVRLKQFLNDNKIYNKYENVYKAFVLRHISYLVVLSAFKTVKYTDFKVCYRLAMASEFGDAIQQPHIISYLSLKQKFMVYLCRLPFLLHTLAKIVIKFSIYNPGR